MVSIGDVVRNVRIVEIDNTTHTSWAYREVICECLKCGKTITAHGYNFNNVGAGNLCDCCSTYNRHGMQRRF